MEDARESPVDNENRDYTDDASPREKEGKEDSSSGTDVASTCALTTVEPALAAPTAAPKLPAAGVNEASGVDPTSPAAKPVAVTGKRSTIGDGGGGGGSTGNFLAAPSVERAANLNLIAGLTMLKVLSTDSDVPPRQSLVHGGQPPVEMPVVQNKHESLSTGTNQAIVEEGDRGSTASLCGATEAAENKDAQPAAIDARSATKPSDDGSSAVSLMVAGSASSSERSAAARVEDKRTTCFGVNSGNAREQPGAAVAATAPHGRIAVSSWPDSAVEPKALVDATLRPSSGPIDTVGPVSAAYKGGDTSRLPPVVGHNTAVSFGGVAQESAATIVRIAPRSDAASQLADFWQTGGDDDLPDRARPARTNSELSLLPPVPFSPRNDDSAPVVSSVRAVKLAAPELPEKGGTAGPGRRARTSPVTGNEALAVEQTSPPTLSATSTIPTPALEVPNGSDAAELEHACEADDQSVFYDDVVGSAITPEESGTTSVEGSIFMSERGRARTEGPVGTVSTGGPGARGSQEDTVDVALAALSYANATAATPATDRDGALISGQHGGYTGDRFEPGSSNAVEESAFLASIESDTAAILNLASAPRGLGEAARDAPTSPAARAAAGPATQVSPSEPGAAAATPSAMGGADPARSTDSNGASTSRRSLRISGANKSRDDLMHTMCMICLEKLGDPTEGGGPKLLGLLDSCSHRYCYACILEWSNVTNKCPQCKCRFHTIKAIKELRRSNSRYRGVAISVEDRDQKYSFVDVRDVAVLDPGVGCHAGCLLRGGVDAFQQQGWEFSVECERCSVWFHGLCVGFRQEQAVPDHWFCSSCRGTAHQSVQNPDAAFARAASATVARARGSRRGRVRGRGHGGGLLSGGQDQLPPPMPGHVQVSQVSGSSAAAAATVAVAAAPQRSPSQPAPLDPSARFESTSPPPPPGAAATPPRGRGRPRGSRTPPSSSPRALLATHQAPVATPVPACGRGRPPGPARGRGRPRLSQSPPLSSPPPLQPSPPMASLQVAPAAPAPARGRGRPRLSQNSPEPSASTVAAPARGRGRPRLSDKPRLQSPPLPWPQALQPSSLVSTSQASSTVPAPARGRGRPLLTQAPPLASPPPLQRVAPPASSQVSTAAPALAQGRAKPRFSLTVAVPSPSTAAAPARGRGRPRLSQTAALPTLPPPMSQRPHPLSSLPSLHSLGLDSTSQTPSAVPAPAQGRGRPRLSQASPLSSPPPSQRLAPPVSPQVLPASSAPAKGQAKQRLSLTSSEPSPSTAAAPARGRGGPPLSQTMLPPPPMLQQPASPTPLAERTSASPPVTSPSTPPQESRVPQQQPFAHAGQPRVADVAKAEGARAVLPEPPAPSLLRSLVEAEVTELCDICGFDTEPENLIVYCGSCNMGVHQTCYGISEIPSKEWYCSPCSAGVHPSTLACRFCPVKGGALKRCTDGTWGHILCAFWIPECCFLDPQKMEPIGSINKRGQAGEVNKFLPPFRFRRCHICGTSSGCAIRCQTSACKFHLHPMCGNKAGNIYMEIETAMKKGPDGEEREVVNLVARCPRHNKSKTSVSRDRKSRTAVAVADPLRIRGKTLKIPNPDEDDAFVLEGKVAWYDPERSRYCIVESYCDGADGGGGGGGSSSGGGDETRGCARWITVEKLVGAKAVGVDPKRGERFVVQALRPAEGDAANENGRMANNDAGKNGGQGDIRVKDEEKEEDNDDEKDAGVENDVSWAGDGGSHGEERRSKGDVEALRREGRGDVNEERTELDDENVRTRANGRRRGRDSPISSGSPDSVPSKRVTRLAMQTQSTAPFGHDSQPAQQQSDDGSASTVGPGVGCTSETGKRRPSPASPTEQQQREPLPSVQVPDTLDDPWTRYPIRGRRRRPPAPEFERDESNFVDGASSAKRSRIEEQNDKSCAVPSGTGSDTTPNAALKSPAAVSDSAPPTSPVPAISEAGERSSSCETPQEHPSSVSQTGLADPPLVAEGDVGVTYDRQPGWPFGMELLGQIPVMHVRALQVSGGGEGTYFAGGYTSAGSVTCDRRLVSRCSYRFEQFDQPRMARWGGRITQRDTAAELPESRPQSPCGPDKAHTKAKEEQETQVGTMHEFEKVSNPGGDQREKQPKGDERKEEEGEAREEGAKEGTESEGQQVDVVAGDTMPPSPPYGDDVSEIEDGEIEMLSDGRADIMPPSPRDEDLDSDVDVMTGQVENDELGYVGVGEDGAESAGDHPRGGTDGGGNERDTDVEDMEISSDDNSCGAPDGPQTASSCDSDDDFTTAPTADFDTNADQGPPMSGAGDLAVPSAGISISGITQAPQQRLSAGDSLGERSDYSVDVRSEDGWPTEATAEPIAVAPPAPACFTTPAVNFPSVSATPPEPQESAETTALRRIVREQLQYILRSASKGGEAALASGNVTEVLEGIANDVEVELYQRLYNSDTGGREYKAKYKQLLLSLGNVRNYRLVASVLAGITTPADLATKDAVGLLNSLSSSLNCLAVPLAGRHKQGSPGGRGNRGRSNRRGKMQLL